MKGTLSERGKGTWRIRVEGPRDPATGKRRIYSQTVKGGKRDAQHALAHLAARHGGRAADSSIAFARLRAEWLASMVGNRSPLTIESYDYALRRLADLDPTSIAAITAYELDAAYRRLRDEGYSPASIRKTHVAASAAFAQAVRWKWLASNPCADATPPPLPKSEIRPPKRETVRAVFDHIARTDPDFAVAVHLAAVVGPRRGELCALRWTDLDVAASRLTVARGIITPKGGLRIEKDTKTGTVRHLVLPATTMTNLAAMRLRARERAMKAGTALVDDAFLFPARYCFDGTRPLRPSSITQRWRRLRADVGASDVRWHDLRHHAATQLIAGGVDVRTVMGRLGWTNLSTAQRYIHLVDEADQAAAAVLEGRMSG